MLKPINGVIYVCAYCGEGINSKVKYCSTCKTQIKRKEIFDQNVAIIKENKEKGFTVPDVLKSWK